MQCWNRDFNPALSHTKTGTQTLNLSPLRVPWSIPSSASLGNRRRFACKLFHSVPVPALKTVGAVSNFKITPATEATSAYFNILLFPSQIKFSSTRTQITSKICDFLPHQNCILPPCSWRKTRKRLHDWPRDHFYGKMSQPKEVPRSHAQFHVFTIYLKGFSVHVNRQILFSTKKESISKLIAKKKKKMEKKGTRHSDSDPDPERTFLTETQSPTLNVGCLLMVTCSFSSLWNCTSPCGLNSRSRQDLHCKSCRFLELQL